MYIAIIADDRKKELMTQFCTAYCGILTKHHLCATATTGKYIAENTGMKVERLQAGNQGGRQQILARVACDEIDLLLFFRDPTPECTSDETDAALLRICDVHNIPVATNIATAEILVRALDRGDLDWRELVNPNSDYNQKRRAYARELAAIRRAREEAIATHGKPSAAEE